MVKESKSTYESNKAMPHADVVGMSGVVVVVSSVVVSVSSGGCSEICALASVSSSSSYELPKENTATPTVMTKAWPILAYV